MKEFFRKFMLGRYGIDQLGRALNVVIIILIVSNLVIRSQWLNLLCFILIGIYIARILSRNRLNRQRENIYFCQKYWKVKRKVVSWKDSLLMRKNHRVFSCPVCDKKMKTPKGAGKIKVTCPHCGHQFEKRS